MDINENPPEIYAKVIKVKKTIEFNGYRGELKRSFSILYLLIVGKYIPYLFDKKKFIIKYFH